VPVWGEGERLPGTRLRRGCLPRHMIKLGGLLLFNCARLGEVHRFGRLTLPWRAGLGGCAAEFPRTPIHSVATIINCGGINDVEALLVFEQPNFEVDVPAQTWLTTLSNRQIAAQILEVACGLLCLLS